MTIPTYLKVLWRYKWLLTAGFVVAIVTGIFAGYSIGPAGLQSRTVSAYTASNTLLITSAQDTLYQAEVPAQEIPEGHTAPQSIDLSNTTVIYAYIIAGSGLRDRVTSQIGPIDPETESISAVRRTTQPSGDERFPGNLRIPVLDVVATAATPERAELLARVTTESFLAHVTEEQDKRGLDAADRVQVNVINAGPAVESDQSNPNIPVVFTAFGIMVAVIALVFAIDAFRTSRGRKHDDAASADDGDPQGEVPLEDAEYREDGHDRGARGTDATDHRDDVIAPDDHAGGPRRAHWWVS